MGDAFVELAREAAVRGAQEAAVRGAQAAVVPGEGLQHRELMRRVKTLVSVLLAAPDRAPAGALAAAHRLVTELAARQGPSGLFEGGDNVESPPDSAFTINDACDVHHLLREAAGDAGGLAGLRDALGGIILAAAPALLAGGVHTPNHRWELSAALARIHRSFPESRLAAELVERVDEWLAEGVDIDDDGYYSERSPNYAAAVSNPSLTAIADILDRPELHAAVLRNLELTLTLIGPDGSVETLPSRRQDQGRPFPLARYAVAYRRAALDTGRGDFAWAAARAIEGGMDDPGVLAEVLLHPALAEEPPAAVAPDRSGTIVQRAVSLAVRRAAAAEVVVYGGSDYARHRRIRSGLANDPTFLRMFAGEAVLDSVRLSRTFFGLGPFRASGFTVEPGGIVALTEQVAGHYYQPLAAERRRGDGAYALEDEGRFAARMAFGERARDAVELHSAVRVDLRDDGADLEVVLDGPRIEWTLELAFREGGVLETDGTDDVRRSDGARVLGAGGARYVVGADAIRVEVDGIAPGGDPKPYFPGEEYAFLGGTDAAGGVRLLLGGVAPARFRLALRAERAGTAGSPVAS